MTFMGERVLIVDDDHKLRSLLREYLEGYGFDVLTLSEASSVMKTIRTDSPDMVILDIMLPGKNGLDVLRDIRRESAVPVIMLTAKGEETDRIVGLELGADDYLPKPFNPRELLARVKAVLRRRGPDAPNLPGKANTLIIRSAELALDTAKQTVRVGEGEVELSSTEYRILKVLMERPNTVLSREQIMNLARGRDFMAFDRSIDVHISKLRSKLEVDPKTPRRIKTVWGTGYMFIDSP